VNNVFARDPDGDLHGVGVLWGQEITLVVFYRQHGRGPWKPYSFHKDESVAERFARECGGVVQPAIRWGLHRGHRGAAEQVGVVNLFEGVA
jgi:hypothetical protein